MKVVADIQGRGWVLPSGRGESGIRFSIDRNHPSTPMHVGASVEVQVSEATGKGVTLTKSIFVNIDTTLLLWDLPFEEDRKRCAGRLRDLIRRYTPLRRIIVLLTLPDPPEIFSESLAVAARLEEELSLIGEYDAELAATLREQLTIREG